MTRAAYRKLQRDEKRMRREIASGWQIGTTGERIAEFESDGVSRLIGVE